MCTIKTPNDDRRILRVVWYLTTGRHPELLCQWTMKETPLSPQLNRSPGKRNQSVMDSCDTKSMVACA